MKRLFILCVSLLAACTDSLDEIQSGTIILPGLPHLEWMTENLSGHGGSEVNGRWYYTYDRAKAAARQLGDGWRLPTREDYDNLCALGSTMDVKRGGCWVGGNHANNHKGSLFFPATGYPFNTPGLGAVTQVGRWGYYWSSTIHLSEPGKAYCFSIDSSGAHRSGGAGCAYALSVRLVRSVQ